MIGEITISGNTATHSLPPRGQPDRNHVRGTGKGGEVPEDGAGTTRGLTRANAVIIRPAARHFCCVGACRVFRARGRYRPGAVRAAV